MKLFKRRKRCLILDSVQAHIDNIVKYREENPDIFIGCTTTNAQVALHCLKDVLLGEDWYVVDPLSTEQCNTLILDEILYQYYKPYRKLCKKKRKEIEKKSKRRIR